jgi:hypothetical protein
VSRKTSRSGRVEVISPSTAGYAHGWREDIRDPLSKAREYLKSFEEARADKRKRDAAFVKSSTAGARPPVRQDQKFSFGLKRRPQGYDASMAHKGSVPAWSDGKGPQS